MLHSRGALDEATILLKKLVEDDVYGAALQLGNILDDDLGDTTGAIAEYRRGIESGDAHSAFNLAILYYREGDLIQSEYFKLVARELGDMTFWPDDDAGEDEG